MLFQRGKRGSYGKMMRNGADSYDTKWHSTRGVTSNRYYTITLLGLGALLIGAWNTFGIHEGGHLGAVNVPLLGSSPEPL